ncbi:hypothetical protein ACERK3_15695 [Phycisphaerales bacterium AB-hyl4]|uniref:Uncharacterized protein n=1 Tax=Natronomicrosphaera hydrolytica TaxID=3242702 RepID=A0ABV4U7Z2_9BACT
MMSNVTSHQICDERTANRIARRINAARSYAKHVDEWAAAEIRRAQKQEERLLQWFAPRLEAWARWRLGGGRRRSIALPGGTLSLRRQPVRPTVVAEAEVLAWCRDHLPAAIELDVRVAGPQVITVRQWLEQTGLEAEAVEKLRRRIVAEHVKVSGEMPPGMEMGGGDERLYIS